MLIEVLENIDAQVIVEHCKTGRYFGPFNMLQVKILKSMYIDYLKDRVEGFTGNSISNDSELVMAYFDNLPTSLRLLGDVLCKYIPDEKVLKHTGTDIKRWAKELFNLLKKNDDI